MEFVAFPKVARLSREIVVSEKIDGTNASVHIENARTGIENVVATVTHDGEMFYIRAGSRSRWIIPSDDNYGFARWVAENAGELAKLGPGHHFGEWWGRGIQRNYSQDRKRFSLFNVSRWCAHGTEEEGKSPVPACCDLVPVLHRGEFDTNRIRGVLHELARDGSQAAPGFMDPEGIMVYHVAGNVMFKKTIKGDEMPKSLAA